MILYWYRDLTNIFSGGETFVLFDFLLTPVMHVLSSLWDLSFFFFIISGHWKSSCSSVAQRRVSKQCNCTCPRVMETSGIDFWWIVVTRKFKKKKSYKNRIKKRGMFPDRTLFFTAFALSKFLCVPLYLYVKYITSVL